MPEFTKEQKWAMTARGGTVLVSAAAGSGKTTVLVQRVIGLLLDEENPCPADRLLIVTFTRAAAAEMRERLARELTRRLTEDPDNSRLRRQKLLLQKAHIGTIHSFCTDCLREYFAKAAIAPDFRIADPSELKLMRAEILDELLESRYNSGDERFMELARLVSGARGDGALADAVRQIDSFISAFPDPELRLREICDMYSCAVLPQDTVWGKRILKYTGDFLCYLLRRNRRDIEIIREDSLLSEKFAPAFESDGELLESLIVMTRAGQWDRLAAALRPGFAPLGRISKDKSSPEKERMAASRQKMKDAITKKLAPLFVTGEADFAQDCARLSPVMELLTELTAEYRDAVAARKSERGVLEYDDLEHMTVGLLCRMEGGQYIRTDVAREISLRFDEILLDEYQDTNGTQDLIFRAISKQPGDIIGGGDNLFLVGDIKQSIYGFRKAVPALFLSRFDSYAPYNPDAPEFPARITLGRNFRSRPQVTEIINFMFRNLMTRERGGIEYDAEQELIASRSFPQCENTGAELHILCSEKADEDDTRDIIEARYCARLIRSMLENGQTVTDGDGVRPARMGDFCILRRSISGGHGDAFVSQMSSLGIPVSITADSGFWKTPEVSIIMSLLRTVDNPLQDIPLLAALRSPIFGFDCDKLASMREGGSVYSRLAECADKGDDGCAAVLDMLGSLRALAATLPSDRLISRIYRMTGLLSAVQAMPGGRARRANLHLLTEYAHGFESGGFKGLSRFIYMTDRLIEQDEDSPCANIITDSDNAVAVKTIHNSKGLEFPIVILAGMGSAQNSESTKGSLLLHPEAGAGMKLRNFEIGSSYSTVQRDAAALYIRDDTTAEELRVLYVALTRAVDKLIMLNCGASPQSMAESAAQMLSGGGIEPFELGLSPSFGRWVTACALMHPQCAELRELAGVSDSVVVPEEQPLRVVIAEAGDSLLAPVDKVSPEQVINPEPDPELAAEINRRLDYEYPYCGLRDIPAKVTASEVHSRADGMSHVAVSRPSFMMSEGLSPTERGTALHKYMQYADFSRAAADPKSELERLTLNRYITEREGSAVDLQKVRAFFSGEAARLIAQADRIEREWRFTAELEPSMRGLFTSSDASDETIVLEGECDCLLIINGRAVILDYKTDRVSDTSVLIEEYSNQLRLYASAVSQILHIPVDGCYIYSFHKSVLLKVEL